VTVEPRAPSGEPSADVVTLSGSSGSAFGAPFGGPLFVLVLVVPGVMLLLSLMPTHTAAAAGAVGRVVIQGRVMLAALALAIWLGVLVSMLFGGSV
jgi:hypothetical protein